MAASQIHSGDRFRVKTGMGEDGGLFIACCCCGLTHAFVIYAPVRYVEMRVIVSDEKTRSFRRGATLRERVIELAQKFKRQAGGRSRRQQGEPR